MALFHWLKFKYIQIQFFEKVKKTRKFFVNRLEQILSRLVKKVFENDIVSLVKIQIYSNSNFLRK
jgi:hypothetical protein